MWQWDIVAYLNIITFFFIKAPTSPNNVLVFLYICYSSSPFRQLKYVALKVPFITKILNLKALEA